MTQNGQKKIFCLRCQHHRMEVIRPPAKVANLAKRFDCRSRQTDATVEGFCETVAKLPATAKQKRMRQECRIYGCVSNGDTALLPCCTGPEDVFWSRTASISSRIATVSSHPSLLDRRGFRESPTTSPFCPTYHCCFLVQLYGKTAKSYWLFRWNERELEHSRVSMARLHLGATGTEWAS